MQLGAASRFAGMSGVLFGVAVLVPPLSALEIRQDLWATDGTVSAVAESGSWIYLGGTFSRVGPATGSFVPVDAVTGEPAPVSFPHVNGIVRAFCADGSGGWFLGGDFTHVEGTPRARIAHVAADGSVTDLDPGVTGISARVLSLALDGSILYVGGHFAGIGGQPRNNLAALDLGTGQVTSWDPDVAGVSTGVGISALVINGGTVYVAGYFNAIGGVPRENIAALDPVTGDVTPWDPSATGNSVNSVWCLVLDGATLYAGGDFKNIGGQPRNNLAALDIATGMATAWDPGAAGVVITLLRSGSLLYVGGQFTSIGGQPRVNLAAVNVATGTATAWDPSPDLSVQSLAVIGSTVYAGGYFRTIGGQSRARLAAIDAATGLATSWDPSASAVVRQLQVDGSNVWAAGDLDMLGGMPRANLAALDAVTGEATAWNPGANGSVDALTVAGSTVYVGGSFTSVGGQSRNRIAALDATTGTPTGWDPDADNRVRTLVVDGTTVYAGGDFLSIGGQSRTLIAALDGGTGAATSWAPPFVGVNLKGVHAIALSASTAYVGGEFSISGGTTVFKNLGAFDRTSGAPSGWAPDQPNPGPVRGLTLSGGNLYVAGDFTSVGLQPRGGIAALDLATGDDTGWNPDATFGVGTAQVHAVVVDGATVYAGGLFDVIGGQARDGIAAIDPADASVTPWDLEMTARYTLPTVHVIRPTGSGLIVGGDFISAGGFARKGIVVVEGDPTPAPELPVAATDGFRLEIAPNPFRGSTRIRFVLPDEGHVRIDVFDVAGRRVAIPLDQSVLGSGAHEVGFGAGGLASGVYLARLRTERGDSVTKLLLRR